MNAALIVADDAFFRYALGYILNLQSQQLNMPPYKTYNASSLEEAVDFLKRQMPDLVLLEWKVFDRKGVKLVHWIRQNQGNSILPIIVFTPPLDPETRTEVMNAGATGVIDNAPLDTEEIFLRIRLILGQWKPSHQSKPDSQKLE